MSKGFIFTILMSIIWALSIFTNKIILNQGENEFNLILWTSLLSIPYWLYIMAGRRSEVKTLGKKGVVILLLIALISAVGVKVLETLAIKNTTSINFSFLVRTVVIFTILVEYLVFRKPVTFKKILLAILILCGVYLLIAKGQSLTFSLGDLLTFAEALAIAIGNNVLGKYATNLMSTKLSAGGSFFLGLIPIIIMCFVLGKIGVPNNIVLILLATFISIVLTIIRYEALKASSASFVTMVVSITPFWVTLLAVSFLGESISLIQIVGGVIIISSVFVVEKLKL